LIYIFNDGLFPSLAINVPVCEFKHKKYEIWTKSKLMTKELLANFKKKEGNKKERKEL